MWQINEIGQYHERISWTNGLPLRSTSGECAEGRHAHVQANLSKTTLQQRLIFVLRFQGSKVCSPHADHRRWCSMPSTSNVRRSHCYPRRPCHRLLRQVSICAALLCWNGSSFRSSLSYPSPHCPTVGARQACVAQGPAAAMFEPKDIPSLQTFGNGRRRSFMFHPMHEYN